MSEQLVFRHKDEDTFILSGLDDFLMGLVAEIPKAGVPSREASMRIFPSPTAGADAEADAEWETFVKPDLDSQFALNRNRVAIDLKGVRHKGKAGFEMEIPAANLPAWIHALNQARLCLTVAHNLGEKELEGSARLHGPSGIAIFQIQFYGILQEWMLAVTKDV
jgi:hypothetical protein